MKDLDFDELDRAVNSLMTKAPDDAKPPADDSEKTLTIDSKSPVPQSSIAPPPVQTQVSSPTPAPESLKEEEEVASSVPTTPTTTSVATRRGRFMDVVRPGAKPVEPVSRSVSRQGATIQPSGPLVTDVVPPTPPSPPVAKEEPPIQQPATEEKPSKSEWPDPLDMMEDRSPATTSSVDAVSSIPETTAPSEPEPLASPFLRDAKVEKRPLGGAFVAPQQKAAEPTDKEMAQPTEGDGGEDVTSQLPANPPMMTTQHATLPEELSGDVMALESDANTVAMPAQDVTDKAVEQVRLGEIPEPKEQEKPKEDIDSKASTVSPVETALPPGPISIPQQYREAPNTGDKETTAIYDTEAYHQPLAHPAKKKSGWLWVLWIVLILALGAGGGAALYFLGVF